MELYSNRWLRLLLFISFFVTITEGFCESVTLKVPVVQNADRTVHLLLHPDENSFGLNPYFPNVPDWQNSIFRKENKPEIASAFFFIDPVIITEKISKDLCLAAFAKAVQSGQTSRQFIDRMERMFDSFNLEEALVQHFAEMQGLTTLHWTKRGVVVQQVPRILKLYNEHLPQQKLIIDYLASGEHYYLKLNLVYPGIELMARSYIQHLVGDKIPVSSCKIPDESLDKLALVYFLFLKNMTTEY